MTVRVEYLDEEPNGLAAMIGGLIEANLVTHPERERLLRPRAAVGIVAADAGVALTLRLAPGRITVGNGLSGKPQVVVRGTSETLTGSRRCPCGPASPTPWALRAAPPPASSSAENSM